jgi:hypothetical protein
MRTAPGLLAVAVLLALAGCVPSDSHASAAPSASATPLFASDAEALAAAEKAYAAYLRVSAEITADGGSDSSRIDPLVTKAQAVKEHETYRFFADKSLRTTGVPTLGSVELQQVTYRSTGDAELALYVCVDATSVRVIDLAGEDVTPSDRVDQMSLEVTMRSSEAQPTQLLLAESNTWSGAGVCT